MSYSVTISGHAPTVEAERDLHAQLNRLLASSDYDVSQHTFIGSVIKEHNEIVDVRDREIAGLREDLALLRQGQAS